MHGRRFCMRWIIRGWPGPSADGMGPRLAPNNANGYLRIYIRELNEEILAFSKAQTRSHLPPFLPVQVDIDYWFQEVILFGLGLGKLLNERVQDALGLSAAFLGSIAVEIRQFLRRRVGEERIDDC